MKFHYEVEIHDGRQFHALLGPNGTTHFPSLPDAKKFARSASRVGDPVRVLKVTTIVVAGYDRQKDISPLRRE